MTHKNEGSLPRTTFLQQLTARWPGLVYVSFGLFISYVYIIFDSKSWLSDLELNGHFISMLNICALPLSACVLILSVVLQEFTNKLLFSKRFVVATGVIAALASALIILAGPYYTGIGGLYNVGAALLGVSIGLFSLIYGRLFTKLRPSHSLLYISMSFLIFAAIYFIVRGSGSFQLVDGAASLSAVAALVLLPLVAAAICASNVDAIKANDNSNDASNDNISANSSANLAQAQVSSLDTSQDGQESSAAQLSNNSSNSFSNKAFIKLLLTTVIFAFAVASIKASFVSSVHYTDLQVLNDIDMMLVGLFAAAFLCFAIKYKDKISFGKTYLLVMLAVAITCVLIAILDSGGLLLSVISSLLYNVYDFLSWSLLALMAYQNRKRDITIIGLGRGFMMIGTLGGWIMGDQIVPILLQQDPVVMQICYGVMALLVLLCALFVFTEKDLDTLFSFAKVQDSEDSEQADEFSLQCARCARFVDASQANGANGASGQNGERPFKMTITKIATRFGLSNRERDIFTELAFGRSVTKIAQKHFITDNTVRSHTRSIYLKLGVSSHDELITLVDNEHNSIKA